MWQYMNGRSIIKAFGIGIFFSLLFIVLPVYAQGQQTGLNTNLTVLSPESILANIKNTIPALTRFATAFAYVFGMVLVILGVVQLKHAGEMRTQMSHEHHLTKPLLMIAMGTLLIYLPSAVNMGLTTFWAEPNPYGYIEQTDQWQEVINVCFAVVQFIGVVAFIRGLILLSRAGEGGHQGNFGKGMMHVIGGIFCINIYQVIQVVFATIGVQT